MRNEAKLSKDAGQAPGGAEGKKARMTERTQIGLQLPMNQRHWDLLGQPNKAQLSKNTGHGGGAPGSESKDDETNPSGLPLYTAYYAEAWGKCVCD